jgi:hypothetical protein
MKEDLIKILLIFSRACLTGALVKQALLKAQMQLQSKQAVQAVSTFCKYLVSINAAGTVTVTKGTSAATSALALVPNLPANSAPLGYFEIETDASTTYTAGTTDNGAAGITDTYTDLSSVVTES